jgi:hypothetical protein
LVYSGGDLRSALKTLDDYCLGVNFILGHNIIDFDLPQLAEPIPAWPASARSWPQKKRR